MNDKNLSNIWKRRPHPYRLDTCHLSTHIFLVHDQRFGSEEYNQLIDTHPHGKPPINFCPSSELTEQNEFSNNTLKASQTLECKLALKVLVIFQQTVILEEEILSLLLKGNDVIFCRLRPFLLLF